jgi:hypothetical protein
MAELSGKNYTKAFVNVPSERPNVGEYGGAVKVLLDTIDAGAAADTVNIGKLPKGAKVLSVNSVGLGGAGASVNVAVMEAVASEKIVIATIGAAPSFPLSVWIEYSVA